MFRRCSAFCLLVLLLPQFTTLAAAQGRKKNRPQRENLNQSGTIKGLSRGVIQFLADDGGKWLVRLPERRENLTFTASADLSWLQRGMLVRFTGEFDKKGKSQTAISELEVFNLREGFKLGIFPDENLGVDTSGLFSSDGDDNQKKKRKKRSRKRAKPKKTTGKFLVAGRLASVKGSKISVAAGGVLVQAEMSAKPRISVQLNDIRFIREGDKVRVEAWYPQGQKAAGKAIANKLAVTAAKPLAAVKRVPRKSGRRSSKAAKSKKAGEKKSETKDDTKKADAKKADAKKVKKAAL